MTWFCAAHQLQRSCLGSKTGKIHLDTCNRYWCLNVQIACLEASQVAYALSDLSQSYLGAKMEFRSGIAIPKFEMLQDKSWPWMDTQAGTDSRDPVWANQSKRDWLQRRYSANEDLAWLEYRLWVCCVARRGLSKGVGNMDGTELTVYCWLWGESMREA